MSSRGPIIINKFSTHEEAAHADDLRYANMSFDDKFRELISLLQTANAFGEKIARTIKKYPLLDSSKHG